VATAITSEEVREPGRSGECNCEVWEGIKEVIPDKQTQRIFSPEEPVLVKVIGELLTEQDLYYPQIARLRQPVIKLKSFHRRSYKHIFLPRERS